MGSKRGDAYAFCRGDERLSAVFRLADARSDRWDRAHRLDFDEWGRPTRDFADEDGNLDEAKWFAVSRRNPHRLPFRLLFRAKALIALALALAAAAVDTDDAPLRATEVDDTVAPLASLLVDDLVVAPSAPPRPAVVLAAA